MATLSIPYHRESFYKERVSDIFSKAGISVNGNEDYDIVVKDDRFFQYVLAKGSLGLGESYINGWWDCRRLDIFFTKIIRAGLDDYVPGDISQWWIALSARLFNFQSPENAFDNAAFHYNVGNDLFLNMLDSRLTYTCGYWKNAFTLDEAQEAKLELTCRKLYLDMGMSVLDIGCGWGSFACYAAEKYHVNVTGITLSREQLALGKKLAEGLPVTLELKDYRQVTGQFDRIVSLGMFEHVGVKNYRTFFQTVEKVLKPNGLFLLHTIGTNESKLTTDPWLEKYIFPNSHIPGLSQMAAAFEGLFVLEDLHNFGVDYDATLMAWHDNLKRNYDKLKSNYSGRFFRMWQYYLLCCAGSFRARKNQLWQIVFSKGLPGGYHAIR